MYGRVQPRHPFQIVIWLAKHAFWADYRPTGSYFFSNIIRRPADADDAVMRDSAQKLRKLPKTPTLAQKLFVLPIKSVEKRSF